MSKVFLTIREDLLSIGGGESVSHGATIEPINVRIGPMYSGSGFRNSDGTSQMRTVEYALCMAQQIVDAVNAAGGLDEDPLMDEYNEWIESKSKEWN